MTGEICRAFGRSEITIQRTLQECGGGAGIKCSPLHPRKVSDTKKESVNAIGEHFLEKKIGWFNEWHFMKVMGKLPDKFKALMGGKDGRPSKKD
jgi:hypothetical protein